jgi:hypothetical protein
MKMSTQDQDRGIRAGKLSAIANREFLSENRELLVSFDLAALGKSMLAVIRLDHAAEIREAEPDITTYLRIQERAFLNLFDREAIENVREITSLGWDCIERMRRSTGVGIELLVAPTPVLSADDKLRQEIVNDWHALSGDKVREKARNNSRYHQLLEELLAGDGIPAPGATTYHEISGPAFGVPDRF